MLINGWAINAVVLDGVGGGGIGVGDAIRYISAEELDRITNSAAFAVFFRVKIPDANGTVWDYSKRNNVDWCHSCEYEGNIDAPISTATVKLWREKDRKSLAPLRSDSSFNADGPSIDSGRRILVDVATADLGTQQSDIEEADWHTVFDGFIDSVNWAKNPIVLECRDAGAQLSDTWYNTPDVVVPVSGSDEIQQVLQTLIDLLQLDNTITLRVPDLPSPPVIVGAFRYDIESGIEPLLRLAQINGWDVRFRWSDSDQAFRLTYKDPGRDKVDPDYTITSSQYIDVNDLKIDRTPIRNDITIWFSNADLGGDRTFIRVSSLTSIRRYGRRSMVLQEASDSPIQDTDTATFMAQLALFDIAEPYADQVVEMFYFWPLELHQLIRFAANLTHSDTPLDLAVVAYKHILQDKQSRTLITGRGKPAGSYWQWLTRKPVGPGGTPPTNPDGSPGTPPGFSGFASLADFAADTIAFSWVWGSDPSATFEVFIQVAIGSTFNTGFVSQGSTGTTPAYTFDISGLSNIEPFRDPPADPQTSVNVSIYVVATVAGETAAASKTYTSSYGDGP